MRKSNNWIKLSDAIGTSSLKTIGRISFGLIETKEDYCHKHKSDYVNECLKLPTGKTIWSGCPDCTTEVRIQNGRKGVPIERPQDIEQTTIAQKYVKAKGF